MRILVLCVAILVLGVFGCQQAQETPAEQAETQVEEAVEEVLELIMENASLEFDVIWKENEQKGIPRAVLSDRISEKINSITDAIYASDLSKDRSLFQKIIECCCPKSLIKQVGFENILKRIPDSYLKAVFASRLASRLIYMHGLDADELTFYGFIQKHT